MTLYLIRLSERHEQPTDLTVAGSMFAARLFVWDYVRIGGLNHGRFYADRIEILAVEVGRTPHVIESWTLRGQGEVTE